LPKARQGLGSDLVLASFGEPIPSLLGPPGTSMQVQTHFELSAHDHFQFAANFVVEPIPEPGSITLLGVALVGLTARLRRRKAG
jgi:hypothetical protein